MTITIAVQKYKQHQENGRKQYTINLVVMLLAGGGKDAVLVIAGLPDV
jgi:hypothetical protein